MPRHPIPPIVVKPPIRYQLVIFAVCDPPRVCRTQQLGYTRRVDGLHPSLMEFCHAHNLVEPDKAGAERRFGIRVSLPPGDTFNRLLGDDWERVLWYATEAERDAAFDNMAERHGYYRQTDTPTQVLEKLVR